MNLSYAETLPAFDERSPTWSASVTTRRGSTAPSEPSPLRDPMPDTVGRFGLSERLGDGGMASVYAGTDPASGGPVAIKLIRSDRRGALRTCLAFAREARVLVGLDHPSIPCLVEAGVSDSDHLYLAMDRIGGADLGRVLNRARALGERSRNSLVNEVLLPALVDVARALDHAHARGFVHRDVKPGNIMIDPDGRGWLVDWGLATSAPWVAQEESILRKAEGQRGVDPSDRRYVLGGTPGYIAPEQFERDAELADPLGDVFGLGAVLYEILCGRRAFGRGRGLSGVWRVLSGDSVLPPTDRAPRFAVPADLSDLCMAALSNDPADRPASAAEFAARLSRSLEGPVR